MSEVIENQNIEKAGPGQGVRAAGSSALPSVQSSGVSAETQFMMSMIEQIALNPNADVEKLRAVMDMKMEMFNRSAEIEFNAAMALVQAEMEPVARHAQNKQTNSRYSKLEKILEQCAPIWTKHGFSMMFGTSDCPVAGWYRVTCEVSHRAGHSKHYHADLPPDMHGIQGAVNKTPIHGFGSTTAYGRRYLTALIFNIAMKDEDNDGNGNRPPPKTITQDQAANLKALADEVKANMPQFLRYLKVEKLEDLPAVKYDSAVKALEGKRKQ